MGDNDPGLGPGDGNLEVLAQPSTAAEPGESSLDDQTAGQGLETLTLSLVGPLDDLDRPLADPMQPAPEFLAAVSAIGKDVTQPGIAVADGPKHGRRAVTVLPASPVDEKADHEAERVGEDMTLAPFDLLAGVEAVLAAAFRCLDAVAVDDARGRTGLATFKVPDARMSIHSVEWHAGDLK